MPNGHGGYRRPSNPAPVSGPGAHSRRTDGAPTMTLPDAKYGEAAAFSQIQSGAQMGSPSAPAPTSPAPALPQPTPLSAPTAHPGMPVTAGADAGAGPGSSVLGLPDQSATADDLRRRYGPVLPLLIRKADDPRTSQAFRDQVRYVISMIG